MKSPDMKSLLFALLSCCSLGLIAQSEYQVNKKSIPFPDNGEGRLLVIENIFGNIEVEGYEGTELVIEVTETVKASQAADRKKGLEEIDPQFVERGDVILVTYFHPCNKVDASKLSRKEIIEGWSWEWKDDCDWKTNYSYRLDYKVRVPRQSALRLKTVNDGNIVVTNVRDKLNINNINGDIRLEGVAGATHARTINGDVDIKYVDNPASESHYYTLNGDINAYFRPDLSAKVLFKTFNGEIYTDLDQINPLSPELEQQVDDSGNTRYRKSGGMAFQVGSGAVKLSFETFNGNVYLRTK